MTRSWYYRPPRAQDHLSARAPFSAICGNGIGESFQFATEAVQWVATDIEAQALFLKGEHLLGRPFLALAKDILAGNGADELPAPNSASNEVCPVSRSFWAAAALSCAGIPRRKTVWRGSLLAAAIPSKAPALISASNTLRFTLRVSRGGRSR